MDLFLTYHLGIVLPSVLSYSYSLFVLVIRNSSVHSVLLKPQDDLLRTNVVSGEHHPAVSALEVQSCQDIETTILSERTRPWSLRIAGGLCPLPRYKGYIPHPEHNDYIAGFALTDTEPVRSINGLSWHPSSIRAAWAMYNRYFSLQKWWMLMSSFLRRRFLSIL